MSYKCYLGEVLCIVYSEIAYFRYLFPKSYFETVCLVDVVSHRLIKGKSLESDQLLANIDGICDALSKNFIKTLVVGISINALRPTFIRELYAFQFNANTGSPTKAPSKRQSANDTATTELFLNRLVALLHEMEPLAAPISISSRMTLTADAPPGYIPPSFLPFPTKEIIGFTILPHCGSARVGKAVKNSSTMYMCALCVEGPVQLPTLGSVLCPTPMSLDVDEDPHETVFVAAPEWVLSQDQSVAIRKNFQIRGTMPLLNAPKNTTQDQGHNQGDNACECAIEINDKDVWICSKCERSCHTLCYKQDKPGSLCLTCRIKSDCTTMSAFYLRQLMLTRRMSSMLQHKPNGKLAWLVKSLGSKDSKARDTTKIAQALDIVEVNRTIRPFAFKLIPGTMSQVAGLLFSEDIKVLETVIAQPFRDIVTDRSAKK